jgi:hypothetical protein
MKSLYHETCNSDLGDDRKMEMNVDPSMKGIVPTKLPTKYISNYSQ